MGGDSDKPIVQYSPNRSISSDVSPSESFNLREFSFIPPGRGHGSSSHSGYCSMLEKQHCPLFPPRTLSSATPESLGSWLTGGEPGSGQTRGEEDADSYDSLTDDLTSNMLLSLQQPATFHGLGLFDANMASLGNASMVGTDTAGTEVEAVPVAMLRHVTSFSSAVFRGQAEVSGIALAMIEYISWIRKVPTGIARPSTNTVYLSILETIEHRLRQLHDIVQTKHRSAFRDLVVGIEELGPAGAEAAANLGLLQADLQGSYPASSRHMTARLSSSMAKDQAYLDKDGSTGPQGGTR